MANLVVRVTTGFLKGSIKKDLKGNIYYSFEGIPFAEPPVGPLRFKAPVPVKPWEGVWNAVSKGPPSYSFNPNVTEMEPGKFKCDYTIDGSEDCLYLNVFTPSIAKNKCDLKPVIVYFHGGAFCEGSTYPFGPEVLLTEDVVVVTVGYRLGALGFLVLNDVDLGVTGNAALKDMVLSLKWVNKNIQAFNGDPNNVTIYGNSAGAAAVHFLILSPTTKGLIHRGILYSGVATTTWAKGNSENGLHLAKHLGCIATNEKDVLQFLQNVTAEQILHAQKEMTADELIPSKVRYFGVVVENPLAKDPFLTQDPAKLIVSGNHQHVPMIFGYNNDEGHIFTMPMCTESRIAEEQVVPHWLNLKIGTAEYVKTARKIRRRYLKEETKGQDEYKSENAKKLAGDINFVRPVLKTVKLHSKSNSQPVYLLRLSVATKLGFLTYGTTKGVCHADDLGYTFRVPNQHNAEPGSIEEITRKRKVKLFVNFARTGNPNPIEPDELLPIEWNPVKGGELQLLDLGENLTIDTNPDEDCMNFWDEIYGNKGDCSSY